MSAWKQFLASDIIVTPFTVNKSFDFPYSQWATGSDGQLVGLDNFVGRNVNWFTNQTTTGTLSTQYQALIYSSIKQLYYSNYISSSTGDTVGTASIFPGSDPSGNVLVGPVQSPLYDNYLQSTLTPTRNWPTASNAYIGVISVPSKLYGDYIVPNSFKYEVAGNTIQDDGQGNILSGSTNIGNIIYTQGLAVLTYQGNIFGDAVETFVARTNVTCSFSSSMTIYETQYKCTLRENEFNFSLNPSLLSGSNGSVYGFVTSSYFSPYVTTVGLYDENQNLLAVGKLAQPLPTSATTDTTILVNIDR